MPRLLQISCSCNSGAIGRIAEQINLRASEKGWDTFFAYGRIAHLPVGSQLIHVGCMMDEYLHYAEHRIFDNEGLASRHATRTLIRKISEISPDIIHLHNIHDHWLNYEILFRYLKQIDIPIVWTQHDCWSFTGGCYHFAISGCKKWKNECSKCFINQGILPLRDCSKKHYYKKKELFNGPPKLTLVTVSHWLEGLLRQSFLKNNRIEVIYNGVDLEIFKPQTSKIKENLNIEGKILLVAVATAWSLHKGLNDYISLSSRLPENVKLLMVGVNDKQRKMLPKEILCMDRTQNVKELAEIYSGADIVLNLSYEETFGMTTAEGFACGTPGIVYNCTASPELISDETGEIVQAGDIDGVLGAIDKIIKRGGDYYTPQCRKRACEMFDMNKNFESYIKLYEDLILNKKGSCTI